MEYVPAVNPLYTYVIVYKLCFFEIEVRRCARAETLNDDENEMERYKQNVYMKIFVEIS